MPLALPPQSRPVVRPLDFYLNLAPPSMLRRMLPSEVEVAWKKFAKSRRHPFWDITLQRPAGPYDLGGF